MSPGADVVAEVLAGQSGLVTPFAPGVWAVHTVSDPLFTAGQPDRSEGLETLAEDGVPSGLAAAVANRTGVSASGVFNTPAGASEPGPLLPGNVYEFTFDSMKAPLSKKVVEFLQKEKEIEMSAIYQFELKNLEQLDVGSSEATQDEEE